VRLRTIGLLVTLALGLFAAPLATEAQQVGKVFRIGLLGNVYTPPYDAFRQGLRELGYVEGQNIIIERRFRREGPKPPTHCYASRRK